MKPFLDTNVVFYAFDEGDHRQERARELVAFARPVLSVQTLNEFISVARRGKRPRQGWKDVRGALGLLREAACEIVPVTLATHARALDIAEKYAYDIFDALLLAAALEAGCDVFYSEDMQHGQKIERLVIRNPFRVNA